MPADSLVLVFCRQSWFKTFPEPPKFLPIQQRPKQGIAKGALLSENADHSGLEQSSSDYKKYCRLIPRSDAYSYQYREKMEAAFPHRLNGGISTLKI